MNNKTQNLPTGWVCKIGGIKLQHYLRYKRKNYRKGCSKFKCESIPKRHIINCFVWCNYWQTCFFGYCCDKSSCMRIFCSSWYPVNIYLQKKWFNKSVYCGGAQPNISQGILRNLTIPLPPLAQQQIVSEIEKRLSIAEKVKESICVTLEKAEALRHSILKKAKGKLVPQTLRTKPASVLLERIKAKQETLKQVRDKKLNNLYKKKNGQKNDFTPKSK